MKIIPIIMAGGSGTRLWPMSRKSFPKQFLPLAGEYSLFQQALLRTKNKDMADPWIICGKSYADVINTQAAEVNVKLGKIIYEPVARSTAPAIGAAAMIAKEEDPNTALFMVASDHLISDDEFYVEAISHAKGAAERQYHVAFGLKALYPETGYGYIKSADTLTRGTFLIEAFAEKPDMETARYYVDSGRYSWNSGMFMFPLQQLLIDLKSHSAELYSHIEGAIDNGAATGNEFYLAEADFSKCEDISIDYAVMEKSEQRAMVIGHFDWSDLGSWDSVWTHKPKDNNNNASAEDDIMINSKNSLLQSQTKQIITTIGLEDVAVIATKDAILVAKMDQMQDVKKIVGTLKDTDPDKLI